MIKQFFIDTFTYGFANILSRSISLLLVPFYTRVLSPEDYGTLDILIITGTLVNIVVPLEISQGFARHYSDAQRDEDRIAYASTTLWFSFAAYLTFVIFSVIFAQPLTVGLLGDLKWLPEFRAAVLLFLCNGMFYMLQSRLRWGLNARQYAVSSVIFTIATTVFSLILVIGMKLGVVGVLYGQIAGACIASFFSLSFFNTIYKFKISLQKCKEMLSFSLPLIPSSVNVFISLYIDRIVIKEFLSLSDVGLYGIAYRFGAISSLLMVGFNGALTPLIYNKYTDANTPRDISRIFRYFLIFAFSFVITISLFSREILWLFTTPAYYPARKTIPFISIGALLAGMYIFMPGMDIFKKTKRIMMINVIAGISNLILNIVLVPRLGINGAASATAAGALIMFLLYAFFSQRLYFVPHDWRNISKAAIVCLIAVAIAQSVLSDTLSTMMIIIKCAISTISIGIVVLFLLRSDEIKKIKLFMLSKRIVEYEL